MKLLAGEEGKGGYVCKICGNTGGLIMNVT